MTIGTTDRIKQYIFDYASTTTCTPTIREIAQGCDIASTNTVSHHLDKLEEAGVIVLCPGVSNGHIYIVDSRLVLPEVPA